MGAISIPYAGITLIRFLGFISQAAGFLPCSHPQYSVFVAKYMGLPYIMQYEKE